MSFDMETTVKDEATIKDWFSMLRLNKVTEPQRNDPCICGSGKKYKKCCYMKKEQIIEELKREHPKPYFRKRRINQQIRSV